MPAAELKVSRKIVMVPRNQAEKGAEAWFRRVGPKFSAFRNENQSLRAIGAQ
jgi:hypothetical protein